MTQSGGGCSLKAFPWMAAGRIRSPCEGAIPHDSFLGLGQVGQVPLCDQRGMEGERTHTHTLFPAGQSLPKGGLFRRAKCSASEVGNGSSHLPGRGLNQPGWSSGCLAQRK